jgi:hypothetical protein
MSYSVKPGNIFGRIGSSIGKGLAEQIPKEVARERLASGLQQFEQDSGNLTPLQSLARLAAIPGALEHPQLVQTFGELARQQGIKNAYQNYSGKRGNVLSKGKNGVPNAQNGVPNGQNGAQNNGLQSINFANLPQNGTGRSRIPSDIVRPEEEGQPTAVQTNPLRQETIPIAPWTPERRNEEAGNISIEFPGFSLEKVDQMAADNEARELAQPTAEREKDRQRKEIREDIHDEFIKRLELLTHKKEDDLFSDITGEMQNNFLRTVERDLASNPNATLEDVVEKRAQQVLNIVKSKNKIKDLGDRSLIDALDPWNKKKTLKQLLSVAGTFNAVGDNEELFEILKKKGEGNFAFSPSRAAWVSYPRSKQVSQFTNNVKTKLVQDHIKNAKYYASQIGKLIQPEDHVLSIAQELSNKDAFFDREVFLDELERNQDEIGLTDKQKLGFQDRRDNSSDWGDLAVFPLFRM